MSLKSQRGDTLVEVIFAMVIIGSVLVGAAQIAGVAARQGVDARERSQVAEFLQEQAEGLRNYRDNHSWNAAGDASSFRNALANASNCSTGFLMTPSNAGGSLKWVITPGALGSPQFLDLNGVPTLKVVITCAQYQRGGFTIPDEFDFKILATWTSFSGGTNTSEVHTILSQIDNLKPCDASVVGACP